MNQNDTISKKKIIVDVIVKLMDEEGMKNVTIKDICDHANISVGAFYHYFRSKDSVTDEMYELMDEYFLYNKDSIASHPTTNEDIIDFVTHFGSYIEQWGYYANLLIIRTSIENSVKKIPEKQRKIYDVLREIVLLGIEEKNFSPPIDIDDFISTVFVTIRAYLFEWVKKGSDYQVKENMVRHIKWILDSMK
ncbi:MAG TPA: TetR/AcrR family transcriptional regulator [Tissierellia bacterium]|nr:TetR/AcrR family transcriptional regulator [Tissierellia bacterium]